MQKSAKLFLCWLATVSAGCGFEGGQLALQLRVAQKALGADPRGGAAPERGAPPEGIDAFRLCVQKPTGEPVKCRDFDDLEVERVRVGGIPAGKHRVVTFQGYTRTSGGQPDRVIWCGRAVGVDIRNDRVTRVGLLLTRCSDFTETPAFLGEARAFHTASPAADGGVVLLGGYARFEDDALVATGSAESYDPETGAFSALPGGLNHPRGLHAAMPLSDGRILVAGGCQQIGIRLEFADPDRPGSPLRCLEPGPAATTLEIYDPLTGDSDSAEIPATVFAGAAALGDDRLLLIGGQDLGGNPLRRALLVDASGPGPTVTEYSQALQLPRRSPTAVGFTPAGDLPAEVLVLGGAGAAGPDDPGTFAEWLVAGSGDVFSLVPDFATGASGVGLPVMHAAGSQPGPGRILFSGGIYPERYQSLDMPYVPQPLGEAAVVDMRTQSFKLLPAGDRLSVPRAFHTSTRADSRGSILVAGGLFVEDRGLPLHHQSTASVEWWDDRQEGFATIWQAGVEVNLLYPRAGHSATRLDDGTILVAGGTDGMVLHSSAELFNPGPTELGSDGIPAP